MDADKEGFLRSERSLIQTIGRAARKSNGQVIMYADSVTHSMKIAIDETKRRRHIQEEYNEEHHIVPKTIIKEIRELISNEDENAKKEHKEKLSKKEKIDLIDRLKSEMNKAARELNFERAMELRDIIFEMESE